MTALLIIFSGIADRAVSLACKVLGHRWRFDPKEPAFVDMGGERVGFYFCRRCGKMETRPITGKE